MIRTLSTAKILSLTLTCFCLLSLTTQAANANTLKITGLGQTYEGVNAGPYTGTLDGVSGLLFYCLNENKTTYTGVNYIGTTHTAANGTAAEQESALLASYMLYVKSTTTDATALANIEGAIQMAIWQIMGSLTAGTALDPAAQQYVTWAASLLGSIPSAILNNATVFVPCDTTSQSFIKVVNDNSYFTTTSPAPEPGTIAMLGAGLGLLGLGIRRRPGNSKGR
jgi:hypothetical protein